MRWMIGIVVVLAALAGLLAGGSYLALRGSLAALDGELAFQELRGRATVERDALGVVTISAQNRADAAFATGFVHAQERFFQMDLQRRASAGEMAALFGPAAVEFDRQRRVHGFRGRARAIVGQMPDDIAAIYGAYTDGVNAGLAALDARPFEYFLLRARPAPWEPEDIVLTVFNMWFELTDSTARRDSELGLLRELLPPEVFRWLIQFGTDWDAPLQGPVMPPAPLPSADQFDLRGLDPGLFTTQRAIDPDKSPPAPGSNSWVVSGARTAHGAALLAGDMHLGHDVPNIWFRARVIVEPEGLDVTGVMLSGAPFVVAGSNRHVAWAFTNSYGDWEDLVVIETDPGDEQRYRAPGGCTPFEKRIETIHVRGGRETQAVFHDTVWGPVVDTDYRGRQRALHWMAHQPAATNHHIAYMERVRSVGEALSLANRIGAPPQNFVAADRDGHIGWTIMGLIPQRDGVDPLLPESWADGRGWSGWTAPAAYPRIVDPPGGALWTANARTVDGPWLAMLGFGDHPLGARPKQIRDRLLASDRLTLGDMRAIQLDDRALFLTRWQQLLMEVLTDEALSGHAGRRELRDLAAGWGARAGVDSAGYRLVRGFRNATVDAVTRALLAPVRAEVPGFELTTHSQLERPVWQVLSEQPAHLLDPRFAGRDALLLSIVDELIEYYGRFDGTLADRTWGERNTLAMAHPIANVVPTLAPFLNMPAQALPGDAWLPRVQAAAFGASQRMALSPGREEEGYFHMPGGQSGHPLSPFYSAGHADWATGRAAPFLPGAPRHTLVLTPN